MENNKLYKRTKRQEAADHDGKENKKDKKNRVNIETPRVTAGKTNNNETNPKLKERSSIECLYNTDQLRNKQNESELTLFKQLIPTKLESSELRDTDVLQ